MHKKSFWKSEFPSDLYLENFYRFLARKVVRLLSFLPLSPDIITFLRIPLGIVIFSLFAYSEQYLLLSLLMVLWKLMDKVDGALARESGQVTKFGGWFDIVVDRLFWGFTMLGLTIAASRDAPSTVAWLLLFATLFGHTLFQNFTFLGEDLALEEQSTISWSSEVSKWRRNTFLYQVVFSIYYLWDQVIALALILYLPVMRIFSVSTLILSLFLFASFFTASTIYVVLAHYKTLVRN